MDQLHFQGVHQLFAAQHLFCLAKQGVAVLNLKQTMINPPKKTDKFTKTIVLLQFMLL